MEIQYLSYLQERLSDAHEASDSTIDPLQRELSTFFLNEEFVLF